jgi:predicted flap endonuclease-1-like 5' DNA nuclease
MARSTKTTTAKPRASRAKPKLQTADLMEQLKDSVETTGTAKPETTKPKTEKPATVEQPKERKPRDVGPATQAVIDRILDLRKQGLGYPSICKALNEEGVKTFKGGETWHPPVVRGICMRNGVERGTKAEGE